MPAGKTFKLTNNPDKTGFQRLYPHQSLNEEEVAPGQ
jgi:hypothetical protein